MNSFCTFCILLLFSVKIYSQPNLATVEIASGFTNPVALACPNDGSNRLFVVERAGVIRIIENGVVLATPFLDISPLVESSGNEEGLLGLAFHPEYADSGHFYVNYIFPEGTGPDSTRIARYSVSAGDPNIANPTETTIMEFRQPQGNHNGGDLKFGPDGFLYISSGDGGGSGDPQCLAQKGDTLLGKILRVDIDGDFSLTANSCGLNPNVYGIPNTNPFIANPSICDEIWATGLRNPWRFSFDMLAGDFWIADVGQNIREEINFQPAASTGGENYGWKVMEGNNCFDPDPIDTDCPIGTFSCFNAAYTDPIYDYVHGAGCNSATGGFVYRGSQYPVLTGYYIFGDICRSEFWTVIPDGMGGWNVNSQVIPNRGPTTFGQNESGEVFFAVNGTNASVYQIADANVLPIELISFEGFPNAQTVELVWEVDNALNFSHFEIERRNEIEQIFQHIGLTDYHSSMNYMFVDESPLEGINYYRLKLIDNDGRFNYSPVRSVMFKNEREVTLFPNPGNKLVTLEFNKGGNYEVSITNNLGSIVAVKPLSGTGPFQHSIKMGHLTSGIYFITVTSNGFSRTFKHFKI